MDQEVHTRIADLLTDIARREPPCPDPAGGGCMGTYCIHCAREALSSILGDLHQTEFRINVARASMQRAPIVTDVTDTEKVIWCAAFTAITIETQIFNTKYLSRNIWQAYAVVCLFRGVEPEAFDSRNAADSECMRMYLEMKAA